MISENVNGQSPLTERLFCDCFWALLEQSPKDYADSVLLSVICMHILYVCMWGWPFFSFWPSLFPAVIESIASTIYSGRLEDQEENTINPSGTSRETTGYHGGAVVREEEEEDTGLSPEPRVERQREGGRERCGQIRR